MQADIITILGPTASGKTTLAAHLAAKLGNAEIISADSRQVYKGMDIGTGKDLADYTVSPQSTVNSQQSTIKVPYHLIDIAEAGEKYNLFQYQQDFWHTYYNIIGRGKLPILCGGTGLYIESVLKSYKMVPVPENASLRKQLEDYSLEQLTEILRQYKTLHNTTDVDTPKRAIRAIEIQEYYRQNNIQEREFPQVKSLTIGVNIDRELRRKKITDRLHKRLEEENMVHEVQNLLEKVAPEDLIYYGLEYKYLTLYCIGQLSYEEMVSQLEIAIHQFAKRQMTWFRGMERRGIQIHWIDALLPMEEKVNRILELMNEN
ncbi:MAG: tRNA (adenosine(37)-N6)-dimethylallyltransferase MiaA [Bacteroidaceae bacterium]|nr:tRNA (adenosine(37)-N6)-dimethylallyltransferase MiaA [Bacteroidaceae bacterium]